MKYYFKRFLAFFFSLVILFNFLITNVYAAEQGKDDNSWEVVPDYSEDDLETIIKNIPSFLQYTFSEACGIILGKDVDTVIDDVPTWFSNHKSNMRVVKNTTTGKMGIQVDKVLTDDMLNKIKEINKEPDNGGYELLKTVPASKISNLYFNYNMATASMYNLLKDSNGILGVYCYNGSPYFYKIPENVFYVKGTWRYNSYLTDFKDKSFNSVLVYKNLTGGSMSFFPYCTKDNNAVIKNWNDENLTVGISGKTAYDLKLYDSFSFFVDAKKGINPLMADRGYYLVTNSGVSIPVFNTIDDAVAYSVANNLYYTSSDYTGEGKEIIIEFDQIEQINNGYYDDMYILLQQLIEQKGGNSLTPEQLQQIVDEVRASFGLIKDEINKGFQQQDILIQKNSSILQNIADALNEFFRQTKEFREYMDKMFRDFIDGQKYTPPNTEPSTEPSTEPGTVPGTGTGDDTGGTENSGLLKKMYDTVKDGFSDAVKELKKIKRWSALDTIIDGAGLVTDIVSLITDLLDPAKAADAVAEFVANGADALTGVKDLMTDRFPFCIPADILILMQVLAHEPEAPHFEVPIVLESWGINEKLVIDFSEFEYVSKICRTFLTIAWCFSLMNMTTKITNMKSI